jgi:hypothetical protein
MVTQDNDNKCTRTPFAYSAPLYQAANFPGTLPLPKGQKHPPPTGYTGIKASDPEPAKVQQWREQQGDGNICLRLGEVDSQYEVIAKDVDHYVKGGKVKRGGDQLARLIEAVGPLPDTWISSSRVDGFSGKRFYRVPKGLRFKGQVDKDIEVIQKRHRFAVVWPSYNPDSQAVETWFPPGAPLTEAGKTLWDGTVPDARTLPVLPDAWIDYLTNGRIRESDDEMDMDSTVSDVYAWAYNVFGVDEPLCPRMNEKAAMHIKTIRDEATSHDKIVKAHMNVLWLAQEGHRGWDSAIAQIEKQFISTCMERDKRDPNELAGELFRSRTNGLRRVKGRADAQTAIGAVGVTAFDIECDSGGLIMPTIGTVAQRRINRRAYRPMYRPAYRPMGR